MRMEELKKLHESRPFRPFEFHLADGRALRVDHPEFLARSPSGRTAVLYGADDSFEIIDLLLVSTLSVSNGERRGKRGR